MALVAPVSAQGLSAMAIAYKITVLKGHLPLEGLEGVVPPRIVRLLRGCFEMNPQRRPSASDVVKELMLAQEAQRMWVSR